MAIEFYDNGMVIQKPRIQDEFWYSDYQTVIELISFNNYDSFTDFFKAAYKEISSYRTISDEMQVAIRMWCVLHYERKQHQSLSFNG